MTTSRIAKFLGVALLATLGAGTAFAQYGYPAPQPGDGYYHRDYDRMQDGAWRGQYGYRNSDPANATAHRARSYGYNDGLAEGERDRRTGHSFRPTHSDRYEDASDHGNHDGMSRDEFKRIYREAYFHGYQRGYGSY
jgi:hypothetical protein